MIKRCHIRGRPKQSCNVIVIRISLTLREGEDDDLIYYFSQLPPRKRAVALRIALRTGATFHTLILNDPLDGIENMMDEMVL